MTDGTHEDEAFKSAPAVSGSRQQRVVMCSPKRVQRKRTKGWRMPGNTVYVGRGSKWGNPYSVAEYGRDLAVRNYRNRLIGMKNIDALDLSALKGKNLACWCKEGDPCHADVLLEMANT